MNDGKEVLRGSLGWKTQRKPSPFMISWRCYGHYDFCMPCHVCNWYVADSKKPCLIYKTKIRVCVMCASHKYIFQNSLDKDIHC